MVAPYQPPGAFGKYRVGTLLGKGGMASVFRAEDTLLERPVAIKFLRQDIARSPIAQQRFLREARLVAKLAHPNIVAVFDFGTLDDGTSYLVSELVGGKTLREMLRDGPLASAQALRFARQLALGLASAHDLGVVHRDLKPSNVMVVPEKAEPDGYRLKILDFGIAKRVDGLGEEVTRTGVAVGTPGYMSPEQCGAGEVGPPSDVYSLGVVLFAMLCGRTPFDAANTDMLLEAHRHEQVPPPSQFVACSPAIDSVVTRCLAKEVHARLQTMTDVIAQIDAALATERPAPAPALAPPPVQDDPGTARVAAAAPRLVRHAYEPVTASAVPETGSMVSDTTTVRRDPSRRRRLFAVGAASAAVGVAIALVAHCGASESPARSLGPDDPRIATPSSDDPRASAPSMVAPSTASPAASSTASSTPPPSASSTASSQPGSTAAPSTASPSASPSASSQPGSTAAPSTASSTPPPSASPSASSTASSQPGSTAAPSTASPSASPTSSSTASSQPGSTASGHKVHAHGKKPVPKPATPPAPAPAPAKADKPPPDDPAKPRSYEHVKL